MPAYDQLRNTHAIVTSQTDQRWIVQNLPSRKGRPRLRDDVVLVVKCLKGLLREPRVQLDLIHNRNVIRAVHNSLQNSSAISSTLAAISSLLNFSFATLRGEAMLSNTERDG